MFDELVRLTSVECGEIFAELNKTVMLSNGPLEGNLCYNDRTVLGAEDEPFSSMKNILRQNFCRLASHSRNILEVGFNAGHSAALALVSNPSLVYFGVDLFLNRYTQTCANVLRRHFPDRFFLIQSDSSFGLAKTSLFGRSTFDLIHVDGGHAFANARLDMLSVLAFAGPDTRILIDDCHSDGVGEAVVSMLAQGFLVHDEKRSIVPAPEQLVLKRPIAHANTSNTERRAVVVAATDKDSSRELSVTLAGLQRYAASVNAEFVITDEEVGPRSRLFPKLSAFDHARRYDRALLIDSDIYIAPDAPDIFDIVPVDQPGAFLESSIFDRSEWCDIALRAMTTEKEVRRKLYVNSGVLVLPKMWSELCHSALLRDNVVAFPRYEQSMINAVLHEHDFPVFNISQLFNRLIARGAQWETLAWFHHFAGWPTSGARGVFWERIHDANGVVSKLAPTTFGLWRTTCMESEIKRLEGSWERFYPACDFVWLSASVALERVESGDVALFVRGTSTINIFGPYTDLPAGNFTAEFCFTAFDGSSCSMNGLILDVFAADVALFACGQIEGAVSSHLLQFELTEPTNAVEFRLSGSGGGFGFIGVRLTRD